MSDQPDLADARVGDVIGPVRIGPIAHGGHCVARFEGRVVFVRHALPDELAMLTVTDTSQPRYWRADATTVLEASPDRVEPPCPISRVCGGCDFQHVDAAGQRRLKEAVVREQLAHLAGIELPGSFVVEPADAGTPDSLLGWRTKMHYRVLDGQAALLAHRSRRPVVLPGGVCPIADPGATGVAIAPAAEVARDGIDAVVADEGSCVLVDGRAMPDGGAAPVVHHRVGTVRYGVRADGFWQAHRAAAGLLSRVVVEGLDPAPGESAWDLYCGVGLFAGQLAVRGVCCIGVETSRDAVQQARRNVPSGRFQAGDVERVVRRLPAPNLIVLDPPRRGAGATVCRALASSGGRRVAYVACDPAALGRDLGHLRRAGLELTELRAFDLFPMTHHVECVALLEPAANARITGGSRAR